jgi:hypothetical protein
MAERVAKFERRKAALDWSYENCDFPDMGKDMVIEGELANGLIVRKHIIRGGIERHCPPGAPADLPKDWRTRYSDIPPLDNQEISRNLTCKANDEAAGSPHPKLPERRTRSVIE